MNLNSWRDRAKAQLDLINELKTQSDSPEQPRRNTARQVLRCLHAFAEQQWEFFLDGFDEVEGVEGVRKGFLKTEAPHPIYPAEYALQNTKDQVAEDMGVLLRTLSHRGVDSSTPSLRGRLELADQLAYRALQPANDSGLIYRTTILTYFQKSASIRIIPYAPVAMVGIPLLPADSQDLLSVPHEIGHQVYWRRLRQDEENLRSVGAYFKEQLATNLPQTQVNPLRDYPLWIQNWEEEIFADLYGCLIAGPVAGLAMQHILQAVPVDQFVTDDKEHPAPVIRPYICIELLRAMKDRISDPTLKQKFANAAEALETNWRINWLDKWDIPKWFKPYSAEQPVTLSDAQRLLREVIAVFLAAPSLNLIVQYQIDDPSRFWSTGLATTDSTTLPSLFTEFEQRVSQFKAQTLPLPEIRFSEAEGKMQVETAGVPGPLDSFRPGETRLDFEIVRTNLKINPGGLPADRPGQGNPRPNPVWLDVLSAGGWITGPGGPGNLKDFL
jgi:hypothetical protein